MLTVTYEQFLGFGPCWLDDPDKAAELEAYGKLRVNWSALDILALADVPTSDRLWSVLREELIPAELLHEFACRCAELALRLIENPDPRSVAAIEAKRSWLRSEIADSELDAARDAARAAAWDAAEAAAEAAARAAAEAAARDAAWAAARAAARDAAWDAAGDAAEAAAGAATGAATWDAARDNQVKILIQMLEQGAA